MPEPKITISDLPARPRPLTESELVSVFGGCKTSNASCSTHSSCCSNLCMDITFKNYGSCV
jgi:hypothetical protein